MTPNQADFVLLRARRRIISIYDSVTLAIIVALVVLLFLTDMHELSFITG